MGSNEVKAEYLCVMIIHLPIFVLMFRRQEGNQDDISEMSD